MPQWSRAWLSRRGEAFRASVNRAVKIALRRNVRRSAGGNDMNVPRDGDSLSRRDALALLGASATLSLVACGKQPNDVQTATVTERDDGLLARAIFLLEIRWQKPLLFAQKSSPPSTPCFVTTCLGDQL